MVKIILKRMLQNTLPRKTFLNLLTWYRGYYEPELKLVHLLCEKSMTSIDIGAGEGQYLAHMYSISRDCYVFEPRIDAALYIERLFSGIASSLHIEKVALSNYSGSAHLRILKKDCYCSTIETTNIIEKYGEVEIVNVPVKRLDDYRFNIKVGFIKIDVEGHEESVLQGAILLLKRDHPSIIIEIEERHKLGSISHIKTLLRGLGYKGYYYLNGHLENIEIFDTKLFQDYKYFGIRNKYVNNFIFVSNESIFKIKHLLSA
jgi:FkbM family methyltransferase